MAKEYKPAIRMVGIIRLGSTEWSLPEYREVFNRLNDIAAEGRMIRYLRYSGETGGRTVMRFLGIESDLTDIPDGMTAIIAGEDNFTVTQTVNGTPTEIWSGGFTADWFDYSVPERMTGEVKVVLPSGWTGDTGGQPVDCICTANAYFTKGKAADDTVRLVEYDPQWPVIYEEIAERLRRELPPDIVLGIEHFGSTAIPGMPAKPVIDMLVDIPSFKEARKVLIPYFNKPECEYWMQAEDMCFIIRKEFSGTRICHIHAAPKNTWYWTRLAFRDYLRTHPDDAQRYAVLKRGLAARLAEDREEYTAAKSEFVNKITAKALGYR